MERTLSLKEDLTVFWKLVGVLMGSALLALSAQVAIPLPFTPVPLTMQTLVLFLLGGLLGSRLGALAVLLYFVEGVVGLPVFAAGRCGLITFLSPTGGYLLAFLPATFLVGLLLERGSKGSFIFTFGALLLGDLLLHIMGSLILGLYVGLPKALFLGLLPYLPGELLKMGLASSLLPSAKNLLKLN